MTSSASDAAWGRDPGMCQTVLAAASAEENSSASEVALWVVAASAEENSAALVAALWAVAVWVVARSVAAA